MNLTAITDPVKVAQLHMLDCAALLTCADFPGQGPHRRGHRGRLSRPAPEDPGPLPPGHSAGQPEQAGGLAGSGQRPALGLTGVRVIHARAEEQALEKGFRDSFDLVTARAVAELRLLCELCLPYVKVGGAFLAMKSVDCGRELEEAAHCIKLLGARLEECRDYTIPGTDVIHRLVVLRKVAPTLKGYPRRWAKIQKAPL